ncbi:hypothetical protein BU14_0166s0001 [Porphyra umbilicalis]|uniref:Uncharacterized protein n=1 Tax=Porphyra umbilicalis TaxID=2786 RepID=A0A1X6P7U2_PORUM|nr:hypothetical protein BU14_0166s0001 [Porphyra umbilicalis]|eukprot:OSX76961.1 hypothetical protein BU14_0166s0001 [Porphyra umbilicalis]
MPTAPGDEAAVTSGSPPPGDHTRQWRRPLTAAVQSAADDAGSSKSALVTVSPSAADASRSASEAAGKALTLRGCANKPRTLA